MPSTLSPNRQPGQASIVTLDYSMPEGLRKEHSILYFNPNWDELEDFLADPLGMLKLYEGLFPNSKVAWTLNGPVTARIEPITTFGLGPGARVSEMSKEQRFEALANLSPEGGAAMEQVIQDPVLKKGAFLLEFAPNTRSILIAYMPPSEKVHEIDLLRGMANDSPPQGRFQGGITMSTLCFVKETQTATVHFDIGRSPRYRAQFIVDHLENPILTCQRLNDKFGKGGVIANTPLEKEGPILGASAVPKVKLMDAFNIRTGDVWKRLPSMFIEDIDNTGEPYVCGIVPVAFDDPNDPDHLFLGDIVLKDYPPVPDPNPNPPTPDPDPNDPDPNDPDDPNNPDDPNGP